MLLVGEESRLEARSAAEMTVADLAMMLEPLRSSEAVKALEASMRPRRGARAFGFASLLLALVLMECRRATYRGVVRNLSDGDCRLLGFPEAPGGGHRRPSASTLNWFANHVAPLLHGPLGAEISAAAVSRMGDRTYTIDSTPEEAGRRSGADFNPHYGVRMDKGHILMCHGFPLLMIQSRGNAGDALFAAPLLRGLASLGLGIQPGSRVLADGSYDSFAIYAEAYMATGAVLRCRRRACSKPSGMGPGGLAREYCALWREDGYDPHRKGDEGFMLRFLCSHGRAEAAGRYLRDLSMAMDEEEGEAGGRGVCEMAHRAIKLWMDFRIAGLRRATKHTRMASRFLCAQILSALFAGREARDPR